MKDFAYNSACPTVSVIMPAYNVEKYIEAAIRSVLSQTYQNWELLIVEDCSTDATLAIAERLAGEDLRIKLLPNDENMGVARSRDRAVKICKGTYIAFLDSDDIWLPNKLEVQLKKMEETNADLVYTSYQIVDQQEQRIKDDYIVPASADYESLLRQNSVGCSTVLIRAELMKRYCFHVGFYHEDYVLWLRIFRDGYTAAGCQDILVKWRYIENSRSFNKFQAARNRWRVYTQYLELPLGKAAACFLHYAIGGIKKYFLPRSKRG